MKTAGATALVFLHTTLRGGGMPVKAIGWFGYFVGICIRMKNFITFPMLLWGIRRL